MKYVVSMLALFFMSALGAAEVQPNSSYLYYQLILSDNPTDWQMLEPGINHDDINDTRILDLTIERVLSLQPKQGNPQVDDVIARLFRLLGNSHNGRYLDVLQQNQSRFFTSKPSRYLKDALSSLPATTEPGYIAGKSDFVAIENEVSSAAAMWTMNPAERPKQLPALGTSIDDVFKKYGVPDHVQNLAIPHTRTGNYKVFYYGLGIVQFNYVKKTDKKLTVQEIMPEGIAAAMDYTGADKPLAHAFASAHDKYLRYLVKGGREKFQKDPGLQKVLQEKLISIAKTNNEYALSAMSAAITYLHRCGAEGLDNTLKSIAENASKRSDVEELARDWLERRAKNMPIKELLDDSKSDDIEA